MTDEGSDQNSTTDQLNTEEQSTLLSYLNKQLTSEKARVALGSSLIFGSVFALMFIFALFLYFCIYYSVMPEIIQKVELDLDYSQSLPVGTLDCNELFNKGNTYDLKMLLKVPESDLNFGLGNFVTTISLVTKNDVLIVNRPMHLVYKSKYLRIVETTLKLMFLLFGKSVESQLLETNIMDNYYEDGNNPLQQIIISFNKPIETYSSSILLAAHFRGLAWFMFHWRWTTGALFVVNIMLVEVLLASYVWDVIKSFYVEEIDLDDQDSDNENKTVTEHVDSSSFTSKQLPTNPDESFEIEDGNMFANVDDQSMKHIQQSTIDSRCSDNTEKKQQSLTESLADVQECVQDYSTNANLQTAGSTNTTESQLAYSKPSSEIGGSLAAPASSRNYIKFDNHLITVDDKVPTSIIEPLKPISKSNSVVDEIDLSGLLDQDDEILLQ